LHYRHNPNDPAMEAGLRAVAWQPDFAQAHYFLAVAYLFGTESDPGRLRHAIEELAATLRLDPIYGAGWVALSWAVLLAGDYDGAEKCAKHLLSLLRAGTVPHALPF